jgi:hypothetical protein
MSQEEINKLPLLATKKEVARALGLPDQRSLRQDRLTPVARVVIGDFVRVLYRYPVDGMLAAMCVNANRPTSAKQMEIFA